MIFKPLIQKLQILSTKKYLLRICRKTITAWVFLDRGNARGGAEAKGHAG